MSYKIAFFYRIDKWGTVERFTKEAESLGLTLVPIKYRHLQLHQVGESWDILYKGESLKNFDLFYFRAVGSELEWSKLLALFAKDNQIPVADQYLADEGALRRFKSVGGVMMANNGVRYPRTVYVESVKDLEKELQTSWTYPVVVKLSQGGRHGMSTFWLRSEADLAELIEKSKDKDGKQKRGYLIQEYLPNDGDFRLFVVGYKTLGGFKRAPKADKVVMNKSVGKSQVLETVPADVATLAEKAAKALGVEVAGIDLVRHATSGEPYIIEVNEAPQYKVFEKRTHKNAVKTILEYLVSKIEDHRI